LLQIAKTLPGMVVLPATLDSPADSIAAVVQTLPLERRIETGQLTLKNGKKYLIYRDDVDPKLKDKLFLTDDATGEQVELGSDDLHEYCLRGDV
jgi:hypothetical protein